MWFTDYFTANFPQSAQMPKPVLTSGVALLCAPVGELGGAPESDNYINMDGRGSSKISCTESDPKLTA